MKFPTALTFLLVLLAAVNLSYHYPSDAFLPGDGKACLFVPDTADSWVDSVFNSLSRDERIGQLIMIAAYSGYDQKQVDEVLEVIKKEKVGGLVFFKGGPKRQAYLTNLFQQASQIPLLIAMDAEWGLGMRLDSTISYPKQMMLGAVTNDSLIWQMGYDIAGQLRRIGVHMNFAPVLDINTNPDNPVINSRSFGENKEKVARKGIMYMKGMQDNGLLCTAKHFPGHGDSGTDSHLELPVLRHTYERLRAVELYPFRECITAGLPGIMVAHLSLPLIDPVADRPSSLSEKIVTDLLRNKMGFKGLIITDALNMAGVTGYGRAGDVEAMALAAGNDILLMPPDISKTINAIKREIRKGTITWEDIDARCKKVLAAKKWAGLDKYMPVDLSGIDHDLQAGRYQLTSSRLVEQSLTLLVNQGELMPLQRPDTLKIVSVAIGAEADNEFQKYLQLYTDVSTRQYGMDLSPDDVAEIMELSRTGKLLIISIHGNFLSPVANYGIRSAVIEKVRNLADSANVILTVFANPYMLEQFGDPERYRALVMAYEDMDLSQKFAAQMIFGSIPARGRLPVSSGIYFREGDGMNTDHYFRLKYSIPEECSMDGDILKGIDSIVLNAISKEAFPGCQVLVARNGVVVYHKAFGFHSYDRRQPVELNDIYDLASVTKIAGTLPCLMKLVDEKRVDLDQQLSAYLPALDSCNKGHLVIKEILSHKAGLQAWIPFYLSTLEPMNPGEQLIRHQLSAKYPLRLDMNTYVNRNIRYADSIYAAEYSSAYPIQVANHLFLKKEYTDTIFRKIYLSELSEKKEYKYSDLGFYFMMQIIETMTDSSLDKYVYQNFYKYLGTGTMGFLPLTRFPPDRIVPTENDLVFRRQLLQGYVHDMGAAMLGGVAGHAGLFSDANDLAKIMQMYLQKGFYGGRRFFSPETFDLFNTCYYCDEGIRRGLGFDKPEPDEKKEGPTCRGVSPESFGHSGFTGTFAWADPVSGILYVFLSNRIHPDQDNTRIYDMNVRTNIQQLIQNAVIQ